MAFEELEREVRQDLMMERWRKYRLGIIALLLSLILGVVGYKGWQYYQDTQEVNAANRYFQAEQILTNDPELGVAALSDVIADQGMLGYRTIAQFRLASQYIDQGQDELAQTIFVSIAEDETQIAYFRALATLQAAMLPTTPDQQRKLTRLVTPLLAEESAWLHLARLAEIELTLRTNDTALAMEKLDVMINDVTTPSELRNTAIQIKTVL